MKTDQRSDGEQRGGLCTSEISQALMLGGDVTERREESFGIQTLIGGAREELVLSGGLRDLQEWREWTERREAWTRN